MFADVDEDVPDLRGPDEIIFVQIKGREGLPDLFIGKLAVRVARRSGLGGPDIFRGAGFVGLFAATRVVFPRTIQTQQL